MSTSRFTLTLLLVFFALSATVMAVTAQPLAIEDVVVPVLQNPVSLNGVLVGDEWNDAVMVPVTFRFYNATLGEYVANRTGLILLKHDCVDLWVGVAVDDPTEDAQSWLAVFYDTNGDEYVPGTGDDEKGMMHPDEVFDVAITGPMAYDNDTDLGGTLDIQGASNYGVTSLTYEFVHPLNSGDALGNDPALYPRDEILAHFMVGDPEVDPMLYGTAYTEDWNYLFNLIITRCPVGGEILPINAMELMAPYLLVLTIAVAATVALLKRKLS